MLDQLGLLGALADFAKQQDGRVTIRLDLPTELPRVSAAVEVAIFRIVQTALDNVTKHGQATCCDVQLRVDAQSTTLTITDDGIGVGDLQIPGVGLTSMQERAEELDGTRIQVTVPMLDGRESTAVMK
jgi:signal transduction histidine kinase